jgi:hypothetical protein
MTFSIIRSPKRLYAPITGGGGGIMQYVAGFAQKDPSTLTGLTAWWRADSGIGVGDGSPIVTWLDRVSSFALNEVGSSPLYSATGFNGHPCASFFPNLGIVQNSGSLLQSATLFTVYAAISIDQVNSVASAVLWSYGTNSYFSANAAFSGGNAGNTTFNGTIVGDASAAVSPAITSNTFYRYAVAFDGVHSNVYINNIAGTTGVSGTTVDTGASGVLTVGCPVLSGSGNQSFNNIQGKVAEFIIQRNAPSSADLGGIDAYFSNRYGI